MADVDEDKQLSQKIAKIFGEVRASNATHNRRFKDLAAFRSKSANPLQFFAAFAKTLTPLLAFQRRNASAERVIRFVSIFAASRDPNFPSLSDAFLENFLKFLLVATAAANKTVRFRACQIVSEIIMRLPDDAEVSNELWDEVIDCMKLRVEDKVPVIRTYAVRALSRFANDSENSDILDLILEMLPLEQNAEVRKTLLLSLPPSNTTLQLIIDCTLDVSETVRKAAYCVLGNKFPLQSLSIKQRSIVLQRGLADRSEAVSKECLKLLKDEWLMKCCNGDVVGLLKFLDVETYEMVGESVMEALLKASLVKLHDGESMRNYISSTIDSSEGNVVGTSVNKPDTSNTQLMEAEVAFYWRSMCGHLLSEAQAKGSDAAATMGTEAVVYAAEASDKNDLIERILPVTISDYVDLVKAHVKAGSNYHFASRQLLLLGAMLDFSDATNRKVASALVQELLHMPLDYEVDDDGHMVVLGDGINLGGNRDWADAVTGFASTVHAAYGELGEVVLGVVEELAQPCRERIANSVQWMQCLAVTSLLLENAKSTRCFQGKAIEPAELLHALLLPGAKHINLDVQRIAVRCLGLFGLLEKKPSGVLVKQLRLSFIKCSPPISTMACKALLDLGMWHGPQEIDRVVRQDLSAQLQHDEISSDTVSLSTTDGDSNLEFLDLLYDGLVKDESSEFSEIDENESVQAVLGEGFAKILLLSEKFPSLSTSLHISLLANLLTMLYSSETKSLERLKQCLAVFFEHYPSLSASHKKHISEAFIPVMRTMWPGINGNTGGSNIMVSNMRKRAVQASRFMLQMLRAPLYTKESETVDGHSGRENPEVLESTLDAQIECGEEGLAIRIATEVARFQRKKTSAERSYVAALCRVLVLIHFRPSEQVAIKIMRRLINCLLESCSSEKDLAKDLKEMARHLEAIDSHPAMELLQDQANLILGRLNLDFELKVDVPLEITQTPVPRSTRATTRSRRRVRHEVSSDEDVSPTSTLPIIQGSIMNTRSQRASKTAALTKMTANRTLRIDEDDDADDHTDDSDDENEDEDSDVSFD